MTTPGWYDPDYDDPAAPLPTDVESARAWALPPVIAKRPPFDAWWCPDCQRLQQDGLYLHDHARAERHGTSGSVCPATGVVAVRIGARPPVPAGPGVAVGRVVVSDMPVPRTGRGCHPPVPGRAARSHRGLHQPAVPIGPRHRAVTAARRTAPTGGTDRSTSPGGDGRSPDLQAATRRYP